jgi:hypothetical protein
MCRTEMSRWTWWNQVGETDGRGGWYGERNPTVADGTTDEMRIGCRNRAGLTTIVDAGMAARRRRQARTSRPRARLEVHLIGPNSAR